MVKSLPAYTKQMNFRMGSKIYDLPDEYFIFDGGVWYFVVPNAIFDRRYHLPSYMELVSVR